MNEVVELTPGLQCCLRCRRVLTDRALHDSMEESVLDSIRVRHPEWVQVNDECQPCVSEYRRLLSDRQTRSERLREASRTWLPAWVSRMFGKAQRNTYASPI